MSDEMNTQFDPESIYMPRELMALRAFFQEERDTELNRWRDPENPDMVCYAISDKNHVRVLDERKGTTCYFDRNDTNLRLFGPMGSTTIRYFEAHPLKNLWEDAKVGEYWLVTWSHSSEPEPCIVVSIYGDLFFKSITECRELSSRYIEHAQKLVVEEN